MAIDILNIKPSVISRNLKGKYIAIYGPEKCGKTTFAAQNEKTLICAFELGTNFLAGVYMQPVSKWADFKLILRQLRTSEAKEKYDCIAIDTVAEAYERCEEFICQQNGVQKIGDIPYGGGYALCKKEFEKTLREITMLGYGIICICHSQRKNEVKDDDTVVEHITPAMPARAADVINRLVDIIGYIQCTWNSDGTAQERRLLTRSTPTILAGSRLKHLPASIPFGYKELINAISEAIDKSEKLDGATIVETQNYEIAQQMSFKEIREEAASIWEQLVNADKENATAILKKVEMIFGKPTKLSEITEDQTDLFYLCLLDMRDLLKEYHQQ